MHVNSTAKRQMIAKIYDALSLLAKSIASMDVAFAVVPDSVKMGMFHK